MEGEAELYKAGIDLAKDLAKDLITSGIAIGKSELNKLSVDFEFAFTRFLNRNAKRLSKVKLITNPTKPIAIDSFFEPPNFDIESRSVSFDEMVSELSALRYVVISGIGGSGKSIFLKKLFITFKEQSLGKIPFYIELRHVKELGLKEYLLAQLTAIRKKITMEVLDYALEAGKFLFLFDGLDEVDAAFRERLVKDFLALVYAYEDNLYVVSTRPDLSISGWNEFFEAKVQGFSQTQVVSLIQKIEYDAKIKSNFNKEVGGGLYNSHSAYLSNPLLCLIMLMTFEGGAGIPSHLHLFFAQAFDVLFYRHDATKGDSYHRKFQSELNIDEFRKVFSAFSFFGYIGSGSSLRADEAIEAAKQAISFYDVKCSTNGFLNDLTKSLSLVIKDADTYYYIHRTFQEYFVALYLSREFFDQWQDVVEEVLTRSLNDDIGKMMIGIDRDRFDRLYLKRRLETLLGDVTNAKSALDVFRMFYGNFDWHDDRCGAIEISNVANYTILQILQREDGPYVSRFDTFSGSWSSLEKYITEKRKDKEEETRHLEVNPDDLAEEIWEDSPLSAYVNKIENAIRGRLMEIEERENKRKNVVSQSVMKKVLERKARQEAQG